MSDTKKTLMLHIRASREHHEMAAKAAAALRLDMSQLIRILLETYVEGQAKAAAAGEVLIFPPEYRTARIQEDGCAGVTRALSPSVPAPAVRERKRAG